MKKFLPIFIFGTVLFGLIAFLTFKPPAHVDLSPYVKGSASNFEVFDNPKSLPRTPFFDRRGEEFRFEDFRGKTLLVNFWATWCEPCKEEMPTLDTLQGEMGNGEFQIMTISVDWQGFEIMDPFLKEFRINNLDHYWDNSGRLPNELDTIGLPLTILVDKEGRWLARVDGPLVWDSPDVRALLRAAIKSGD